MVTRRQMANFLSRFLEMVPVGPGGVDIEDVDPDDDIFEDIGVLLTIIDHRAVRVLYEMGITRGASSSRFFPDDQVSRAQMALFITNMLGHTNARPAGVALQTDETVVTVGSTAQIMVSVRDRTRRPVTDASIDLFFASSDEEAFMDNGECDDDVVTSVFDNDPCEIGYDDETTDEDGNLLYDVLIDDDLVLWAWTGDLRDDFDLDSTDYAWPVFGTKKGAAAFELTDDMNPGALKLPFGRSVTFVFQLVDDEGDPVFEEDVDIKVRDEEQIDDGEPKHHTTDDSTDESGQVYLTFRMGRPRSADDDTKAYLDLEIVNSSRLDVIDETTVTILDDNIRLVWDDTEAAPTTLLLEERTDYRIATREGSGGSNSVTATLLDQYGDPIDGETIHFVSDDVNGLDRDPDESSMAKLLYRKTTNHQGEATVRYNRDDDQPGTETIEAFTDDGTVRTDSTDPVEHFWVEGFPENRYRPSLEVLIHDEDWNILVVGTRGYGPYIVTYDSNDQFSFLNDRETFESFVEGLEEGDFVDIRVQSHDRDDVNSFERR